MRWTFPGTPDAYCGEWPNDCPETIAGLNFDASVMVSQGPTGTFHTDGNGTATFIPLSSSRMEVSGDANTVIGESLTGTDGQMWSLQTGLVQIGKPALTSSVQPVAVSYDGSVSFWEADGTPYRWTQGGGWTRIEDYLSALGATSLAAGDFQLTEVLAYGKTGQTAAARICRTGTNECQTVLIYMEDAPLGTLGSSYCGPMPSNSTGASSSLRATGSASLASNDLVLEATQLPPNQFGILLNSFGRDYMPLAGVRASTLCVGGLQVVVRHDRIQDIALSDGNGSFSIPIDSSMLPGPAGSLVVQSGETVHFQVWHRDRMAGSSTTQFTNGVSVQFQ